jgi:hypothetical protein
MKNESSLTATVKQALNAMRKFLSSQTTPAASEEIIVCTRYLLKGYPKQTSFFKPSEKADREMTGRHAYKDFQVLRC